MVSSVREFDNALDQSFLNAITADYPYRHWLLKDVFPKIVADELARLPFPIPDLAGVSGRRELHNATRQYFDTENQTKHPVCKVVAEYLQASSTIARLNAACDIDLTGTYLRLEYAQDTDGFWLEPHTDLGVKKFTMLIYLSDEAGHENLGTDIYADKDTHIGRSPFEPNAALIFIPADNTWHGFEKRPIPGVRKSLILNYVTPEWRAREQLSFGDQPVHAKSS